MRQQRDGARRCNQFAYAAHSCESNRRGKTTSSAARITSSLAAPTRHAYGLGKAAVLTLCVQVVGNSNNLSFAFNSAGPIKSRTWKDRVYGSDNWVTSTENFVNGSFNSIYNWAFSDTVIGNNNTIIGGGSVSNGNNGHNNNVTGSNNTLSNNTVSCGICAGHYSSCSYSHKVGSCKVYVSVTGSNQQGALSSSLRIAVLTPA